MKKKLESVRRIDIQLQDAMMEVTAKWAAAPCGSEREATLRKRMDDTVASFLKIVEMEDDLAKNEFEHWIDQNV